MENFGRTRPATGLSLNNSLSDMKLRNFNKLQINGSITGYDINAPQPSSSRYSRNILNEQRKENNAPIIVRENTKNLDASRVYTFDKMNGTVTTYEKINRKDSWNGNDRPMTATRDFNREETRNGEYDLNNNRRMSTIRRRDSDSDAYEENNRQLKQVDKNREYKENNDEYRYNNRRRSSIRNEDSFEDQNRQSKQYEREENDEPIRDRNKSARNKDKPKPKLINDTSFEKKTKSRNKSDNEDEESDDSVVELTNKENEKEKIMDKLKSLVIPELKNEAQRLLSARKPIPKFLIDFEKSLSESISTLNHVIMKAPSGQTIKCCIKRSSKRLPIYTMYLEKTDGTYQKLLVAHTTKRLPSVQLKIYAVKLGEIDDKNLIPLGKLKTNVSGNDFTLHGIVNTNDSGFDQSDDEDNELFERHLAISYKSISIFSKEKLQKFSFTIPKETKLTSTRGISRFSNKQESNFFVSYANNEDVMPLHFENREPKFNEQKNTYTLNFNGRVTETSAHNFQIITTTNSVNTIMQFGKIGKNTFICDFSFPLTAFQAFAVGLANLCR